MHRTIGIFVVMGLLLVGCSDGDNGQIVPAAEALGDAETASSVAAEATTTTVVFIPQTSATVETPFSIPPLDTDELDVMLDEAFEDDEVTEDELRAILETAGLEPAVAACEAGLLAELGVEDINGGAELMEAVESMTAEQRARLETCLGS